MSSAGATAVTTTMLFVVVRGARRGGARRGSEAHIIASPAAVLGMTVSSEFRFLDIAVAVCLVAHASIPSFIGIERAKPAASSCAAMKRLLICTHG